jgi:hypothetical protein
LESARQLVSSLSQRTERTNEIKGKGKLSRLSKGKLVQIWKQVRRSRKAVLGRKLYCNVDHEGMQLISFVKFSF